jgi:hypothetical protein
MTNGRQRNGSLPQMGSVRGKRGSDEWAVRSDWLTSSLEIEIPDGGEIEDSIEDSAFVPPPRNAQLQQAVEAKLMTFEELAAKIGHKPHKDKTMKIPFKGEVTVRKMSTAYKEVEAEFVATFNKIEQLGRTGLDDFDQEKRDQITTEIDEQLAELRIAANTYRNAHKKDATKTGAIDELLRSIDDYGTMLHDGLDAVLADPAFDTVKGHLNLDEALHAKKCGINFADCRFDLYNDDKADAFNEKFGSGMANSVAKIEYENGETLIFKKEKASESFAEQLPIARAIGIDGKATHNGNRNIGSAAIGDLLGSSVMPKVCYGLHANPDTGEKEIGLLMTMAPGVTPVRVNEQGNNVRRELWTPPDPPPPPPPDPPPISTKMQAELQQQLAELDWCDCITGQQDRHGKNYMVKIDPDNDTVIVTGIDNDVCFGAGQQNASVSKMEYNARTTPPGLPPLIPKKVYDNLAAGDFDRDLLPKLRSLLTTAEVDAARSRFNQVKLHAASLHPDYVVADYATWVSPPSATWPKPSDKFPAGTSSKEYLQHCGTGVGATSGGGLFGRDFAAMFKKDGML